MILNDKEIIKLVKEYKMIDPFFTYKSKGGLSFGLDPFGYTLRLDSEFKILEGPEILDPLKKNKIITKTFKTDKFLLPPKTFVLGKAIEYLRLPKDVTGFAYTKSSYARLGIFANITTIDAGWEGYLTIEIANLGDKPVFIYANRGIAQIHFMKGEEPIDSYVGNYQKLNDIKV